MKKLVFISLFIFWAAVTAVLAAGLVFYQKNLDSVVTAPNPDISSGTSAAEIGFAGPAGSAGSAPIASQPKSSGSASNSVTFNMAEISKHNTAKNCWLLISGKVYNVTGFLSLHPGGADKIIPNCGKDATQAFQTKGGQGSHSQFASSLLAGYFIGNFNQVLGQQKVDAAVKATASVKPNLPAPPAPKVTTVESATSTAPKTAKKTPSKTPAKTPAPSQPAASSSLTLSELAKHNTAKDCWLLISGKIYNVTSFISSHPGGVSAIAVNCGKDATQAFQTQGGKGSHSQYAHNLLASYYIGDLNQTVSSQKLDQSVQQTNSVPPPVDSGDGDEDDDEEDDD